MKVFWISGSCEHPGGKIFRFVRPVAPEIFDRVAFEKELKGNFATRGPSLRRGAHQKPRRARVARRRRMGRRDPRKPLQRAPGDGRRPPRPLRAAVTRARSPDLTTARERRRAVGGGGDGRAGALGWSSRVRLPYDQRSVANTDTRDPKYITTDRIRVRPTVNDIGRVQWSISSEFPLQLLSRTPPLS